MPVSVAHTNEHFKTAAFSPSATHILATTPSAISASALSKNSGKSTVTMDVWDSQWYPGMSLTASDGSWCYLACIPAFPLRLFAISPDPLNKVNVRCTYQTKNQYYDPISPYVARFNLDASKIYCAMPREIQIFNVNSSYCTASFNTKEKSRVSDLAFARHVVAVSTYAGAILLYDTDGAGAAINSIVPAVAVDGSVASGVTQSSFCADGFTLITTSRNSNLISTYDLRMLESPLLHIVYTEGPPTNQRIGFDVTKCGGYVAIGGTDGVVRVFRVNDGAIVSTLNVGGVIGSVSFNPLNNMELAIATGTRHFGPDDDNEELLRGGNVMIYTLNN